MEKRNIPTAVIIARPFASSAKAMAVAHGVPDYPFVMIPHPIAATDRKTLFQWTDQVVDEGVSILCKTDVNDSFLQNDLK